MFGSVDLSKECDKAAEVLHKLLENGKIPQDVISEAKGLAIFHAFRGGMYFAGTSGTGILVSRLPDGSWSPPSAFSIRIGSVGVVYGVDVFDCVCVLNTVEAVEAYCNPESKIGGSLTLKAGPAGGSMKSGEKSSVWTYTKSKGIYGGATLDSMIIKELREVNAEFYGADVGVKEVLAGAVEPQKGQTQWPTGAKRWNEVLRTVVEKPSESHIP